MTSPRKLQNDQARICYAAHEKIVSDLAFHLRLPVPPVILWDRADATDAQWRWCSISAFAYPGVRKFAELGGNVPEQHRGRAQQALSAMVAFDAWVGVEDRNHDNLLVDGDFRSAQPVALVDYCWSLSKQWTRGHFPRAIFNAYTLAFGGLSVDDQKTMADRITAFDQGMVEAVVSRIPEAFLPRENAEIILEGLTDGQRNIHRTLGL